MAQTLGTSGIFFDEMPDSPKFSVDIAGRKIQFVQTGVGNWLDIDAMYAYLMAPTLVFGELFGVFAGAAYPGNNNIRCVKANAEPLTDDITGPNQYGVNLHSLCKWTIVYSNIMAQPNQNQTQDPVPMLKHSANVGGEFFIPKGLKLAWSIDTTTVAGDSRGGIFIPTEEFSLQWPRIPFIPYAAIDSVRGKANKFTITTDAGVYPPETVLFLGAAYERDIMSDGSLGFTLNYKFSRRTVAASDVGTVTSYGTQGTYGGWNHFWRDGGPSLAAGFYRVIRFTAGPDGTKDLYELTAFNVLFPGTSQTW